jgi:arginine-tRNA-protein transferase
MFRLVESPRRCAYLPDQLASLEFIFDPLLNEERYAELLRRGYRRFGWQIFRPACQRCSACLSVRIPVQLFEPTASDRRVLRKNSDVRCELATATASPEHVTLFNRYQAFMHGHRGWEWHAHTLDSYEEAFVAGPEGVGMEWRYWRGDQLIGVSLMDRVRSAVSLVYFFYDPEWRPHSPGRFSILNQILYAKRLGMLYAYLGYWVKDCVSLNYKDRFRPYEILGAYVDLNREPRWSANTSDDIGR